ncbi:hypothetical protein CSC33_4204 [Pseudomonas aeruginosa]|nr:hypothetical protein CSC33_4204 [Pseudomonas aeruginosa]
MLGDIPGGAGHHGTARGGGVAFPDDTSHGRPSSEFARAKPIRSTPAGRVSGLSIRNGLRRFWIPLLPKPRSFIRRTREPMRMELPTCSRMSAPASTRWPGLLMEFAYSIGTTGAS